MLLVFHGEPTGAAAELLAAVRARGEDAAVPGEEPPSEEGATVEWRRLPPEVLRVLRAGALIGPGFETRIVADLLSLEPLDVLERLQEATDRDVPLEDRGEGRFSLPNVGADGPVRVADALDGAGLAPQARASARRACGRGCRAAAATRAPARSPTQGGEGPPRAAGDPGRRARGRDHRPLGGGDRPVPRDGRGAERPGPRPPSDAAPPSGVFGASRRAALKRRVPGTPKKLPRRTCPRSQVLGAPPTPRRSSTGPVGASGGVVVDAAADDPGAAEPGGGRSPSREPVGWGAPSQVVPARLDDPLDRRGAGRRAPAARRRCRRGGPAPVRGGASRPPTWARRRPAAQHANSALELLATLPPSSGRRQLKVMALIELGRQQWQSAGYELGFTLSQALATLERARAELEPGAPARARGRAGAGDRRARASTSATRPRSSGRAPS